MIIQGLNKVAKLLLFTPLLFTDPNVIHVTLIPAEMFPDPLPESNSPLSLRLIGGRQLIEQRAVHLHQRLQHVVDQSYDRPDTHTHTLMITVQRYHSMKSLKTNNL